VDFVEASLVALNGELELAYLEGNWIQNHFFAATPKDQLIHKSLVAFRIASGHFERNVLLRNCLFLLLFQELFLDNLHHSLEVLLRMLPWLLLNLLLRGFLHFLHFLHQLDLLGLL
jgi:hypothetical protein